MRSGLEYKESEIVLVVLEALDILFEYGYEQDTAYENLFVFHFEALKGKIVLEQLTKNINIEIHKDAEKLLSKYFNDLQ